MERNDTRGDTRIIFMNEISPYRLMHPTNVDSPRVLDQRIVANLKIY